MKDVTYTLKVPVPNTNNYTETKFKTREEVCEFLGISKTGFYSIINGTVKYSHKTNRHLEGIIIEKNEKITVNANQESKLEKETFLNKLIAKINESKKEKTINW